MKGINSCPAVKSGPFHSGEQGLHSATVSCSVSPGKLASQGYFPLGHLCFHKQSTVVSSSNSNSSSWILFLPPFDVATPVAVH